MGLSPTNWLSTARQVPGLAFAADAFAGTVNTDVVQVDSAVGLAALVIMEAGGTGTTTITVEACDDTTPSNTTAVSFVYRTNAVSVAASGAADVWGDWTAATAAGFTTAATANIRYQIMAEAAEFAAAGYAYGQLDCVESANDPVLGGIELFIPHERYAGSVNSLLD